MSGYYFIITNKKEKQDEYISQLHSNRCVTQKCVRENCIFPVPALVLRQADLTGVRADILALNDEEILQFKQNFEGIKPYILKGNADCPTWLLLTWLVSVLNK